MNPFAKKTFTFLSPTKVSTHISVLFVNEQGHLTGVNPIKELGNIINLEFIEVVCIQLRIKVMGLHKILKCLVISDLLFFLNNFFSIVSRSCVLAFFSIDRQE